MAKLKQETDVANEIIKDIENDISNKLAIDEQNPSPKQKEIETDHQQEKTKSCGSINELTNHEEWTEVKCKKNKRPTKSKKPRYRPVEEERIKKKPRMKTAREVINRIKWDQALDAECITIIYWDRHYGMTDIKFNDLNWTDDIASTGPEDSLVLPEHRIYTFLWKTKVIWDRKNRIDYVFGSLGEKKRITDIMTERSDTEDDDIKSQNNVEKSTWIKTLTEETIREMISPPWEEVEHP